MAQIVLANNLNVAALSADDLYIQILQPPGYIQAVPTDVFGIVGGASWGPVNKAVHLGSANDGLVNFGGISAASLTDPHDMATDIALAFGQTASQASIEGWGVRVTDGTDAAATATLVSGSTSSVETATIAGSVLIGDSVVITATSVGILGTPVSVTYNIGASDSLYTIAAGLAALINANAALRTAGISATSLNAVVTISYPTGLSVSWSRTSGTNATVTLAAGSASTNGITLTARYTGVLGNQIVVTVGAGSAAATSSVYIVGPNGMAELFSNLPNGTFWAALHDAINLGLSGVRGPSAMLTAGTPNNAAGAPAAAAYTLSGGTDGRSGLVTGTLIGSDSNPGTGIYALRSLKPAVAVVWIVGLTDMAACAAELAFALSEGCSTLHCFATGTSTASALSTVQSNGVHDPAFAYVKDWIYFFDPINNQLRLVPPTAIIGGTICSFAPQISPSNKVVALVYGTERFNPITGNQPYTQTEVGQLESAGVMFITNPIPLGSSFGIRHGQTTSLSPVTAPFEWWRMNAELARSFATSWGKCVGQNQSQQPNDPLRNAVKNEFNKFLAFLKSPASGAGDGLGQIDDFTVICTFSTSQPPGLGVDTPDSIAQHYLFALVRVRFLSSVRFFVVSLQGGTTVVVSQATPGQQLTTLPNAA